jgi:hypothetical protein
LVVFPAHLTRRAIGDKVIGKIGMMLEVEMTQGEQNTVKPDFARGQRQRPAEPAAGSDYARGQRTLPEDEAKRRYPDFAEGQRELPKPQGQHPDFARGMEQMPVPNDEDNA